MALNKIKDSLHLNSMYLFGSIAMQSILGFLFWGIAARLLPEEIVGKGSEFVSVATYLSILGLLGMNHSIIYFLPKTQTPNKLINTYFTLPIIISTGIAIGVSFIGGYHIGWLIGLTVLTTIYAQLQGVFVALRKSSYAFFKSLLFVGPRLPLIVIVATFGMSGLLFSWTVAVAIASGVSLFFFLPKLLKGYTPKIALDLESIRSTWKYSSGMYLSHLFAFAPTYILPVMVTRILGAESNAYFYIAWMVAVILFSVSTCISQALFAEVSNTLNSLRSNFSKAVRLTGFLTVVGILLVFLFGEKILALFGPNYAIHSTTLLKVLALSSIPVGVVYIYTAVLRALNKIRELVIVWAVLAVSTLMGSYYTLPALGIISIGYVWALTSTGLAIYVIISLIKRHKINWRFI